MNYEICDSCHLETHMCEHSNFHICCACEAKREKI